MFLGIDIERLKKVKEEKAQKENGQEESFQTILFKIVGIRLPKKTN